MTATHWALIVTHAAYAVAAVIMLVELVRLRRSAWRLVRYVRRRRGAARRRAAAAASPSAVPGDVRGDPRGAPR